MNRSLVILFVLFFSKPFLFAQQSTASKEVSTFMLEAPQLKTSKKIWVYLPLDYGLSHKKYPVIYMHDAQNLFDAKTSYVGEWNVDETLDSLKAKVIVIGIEHGNEKRLDELTPYKNEKYGGGNANNYLDFIVKTLKPHVDSLYRTKSDLKNTAIFGSSLGGLVSYYAVLKYPTVFGKAGVFSPSFWFTKDIYDLTEKAPKMTAKIYFLCGDSESDDMVNDLNKMTKLVDENRCYCLHLSKKSIVKGGKHNEKLWRENFAKAFLWLMN
jgi:predicted alpha/beta superfamily hydrolase